ncbi:MAG: hypothetical protein U1E65_04860 [Myxococcota bacterium]
MDAWATCASCGLKHRVREDGSCPRCGKAEAANPFASPQSAIPRPKPFAAAPSMEGSYGLGVALGGVLGMWGLIGSLVFAKAATKRGAIHGFLGRLALIVVVVVVVVATKG